MNRSRILAFSGLFLGLTVIFFNGCKKDGTSDTTLGSTITDYEGNVYKTVTIGTQTWMAENLRSFKLSDGTAITYVTDNSTWSNLSSAAHCYYANDSVTYKSRYGTLYNWYAVQTNKLCPTGWHVPTDADWLSLATSLGVDSLAGGKLKDAGSIDWYLPNLYATNSTGFTALPSGYRFFNGSYNNVGYSGNWWSSTEYAASAARYFYLVYNKGTTGRNFIDKLYGLSVRCIQN